MSVKLFKNYDKYTITSKFGYRTLNGKKNFHSGIDFVANNGKNNCSDWIVAHADGEVIAATSNSTAGYYVKIKHTETYSTVYCHIKKGTFKVQKGDKVKKGDVLGYMGNTGNSTGAHLHFGVFEKGVAVDPALWFDVDFPVDEKPVPPTAEIKVGDIVDFVGTKHYTSANKILGKTCKPGVAKVTQLAKGSKHPYHLIHTTNSKSTVYGWVDEKDIITQATPVLQVGDKVKMDTTATVYNKKTKFADWVYNSTLYVRTINNSKITISIYKEGAVTGNVDIKYLTKI